MAELCTAFSQTLLAGLESQFKDSLFVLLARMVFPSPAEDRLPGVGG
jgi:hypothetical protein